MGSGKNDEEERMIAGTDMTLDEFRAGLIQPEDLENGDIHIHEDVLEALNDDE